MVQQSAFQVSFDFLTSKAVVVEPGAAQVSSDAGLLPFRQLDERLGLTRQFAEALSDSRHEGYVDHTFLEMTRMRVYGILADYPDQNDHDVLRSDPIFKLLCDRSTADGDLASQPTLSRFENAVDTRSFFRLRDVLIDQFLASFSTPPQHLTLDIDPFDDATHGQQQLTFFHGYYGQYQYLPRAITCAENELALDVCLLHGTAHAALGADDDVEYVARRLREVWPDVRIHVRGDSGLGVPRMYDVCERLDIDYTFGLGMNARLKKLTDPLLAEAVARRTPAANHNGCSPRSGTRPTPGRPSDGWSSSAKPTPREPTAGPWSPTVAAQLVLPGAAYDGYADRGESENRNKELKAGLQADRLSDHRYFANLFRLYLHTAAYNLLVHMRHAVADPPPPSQQRCSRRSPGRPSTPWLAQSPSRARSAGQRPALHLADALD